MSLDINALTPHPLALLFSRDEERIVDLAGSIANCGQVDEVVVLPDHQIVEGCRRYEAWKMVVGQGMDIPLRWRYYDAKTDGANIWEFIVARNRQRRDPGPCPLEVVRQDLMTHPDYSDRFIASRIHTRQETVHDERAKLVSQGRIPSQDFVISQDGTKQKKPKKKAPSAPVVVTQAPENSGASPIAPAPPAPPEPKQDIPLDAGDAYEAPAPGTPEAVAEQQLVKNQNVPRDLLGNELPAHLRDIFADELYVQMRAALNKGARAVRNDPTGRYLLLRIFPQGENHKTVQVMEELAQAMEQYQPYSVCPHCGGAEGGCVPCHAQGFLSQFEYKEWAKFQEYEKKPEAPVEIAPAEAQEEEPQEYHYDHEEENDPYSTEDYQ